MAEQTTAAEVQPKKSKSNILVLILGAILLLGVGGGGAVFFLHMRSAKAADPAAAAVEKKKEPQFTVHLEPFTVNLADLEENHFLRVTIDLGLAHAPKGAGKEGGEASDFPTARTRDTILSVVAACKANDLLTPEGKDALKKNLLSALQQKVPEIDAQDIYFTEFLVQR